MVSGQQKQILTRNNSNYTGIFREYGKKIIEGHKIDYNRFNKIKG